MMKCPTCGKAMVKGAVISSSSMPFSTNVMFKMYAPTLYWKRKLMHISVWIVARYLQPTK